MKTPLVCRASKLLKSGFYLLVCFVRCSKMLGQFIQIVTELLEIFVCHFCLASKEIFTCPNGFSRTTTLRGEGSIGNQKSARQRFRSKRKPFCNRRSNLTRALQGGVASEVLLYRHLNKKKILCQGLHNLDGPVRNALGSGF